MAYKPESYSEVLRWLEDTEIEYVPHGKKAGTKSYDRYEKYAQAKTVAAALELGSKPLDLVHDFEKKLLKRIGGPVRDGPLNLMSVSDTTSLTRTDLILGGFGYQLVKKEKKENGAEGGEADSKEEKQQVREALRKAKLSAKFGVKVEDMAAGVGWAESPDMVARRSRANVEATKILEAATTEGRKITTEEVLRVLRLWAVKKNGDRKNVMPTGTTWVHSETIGLLHCSGGRLIATLHTRAYPKVLSLLCQWLKDDQQDGPAKDFPFTSIIINSSYSAKRHRDHLNDGPSCIRAFGDFEGGNLRYWPDDNKHTNIESLRDEDAEVLDVRNSTILMDGNRAHTVEEYTGDERFSLVYFTAAHFQKTTDDVREQLMQVGIPFPDDAAIARARGLLPPARGYGIGSGELKRAEPKVGRSARKGLLNKELRRVKKGGSLLARMMAMREQARAEQKAGDDKPKEEGKEQQDKAEKKERKKPLIGGGLFARVMAAKRAKESEAAAAAASSSSPSSSAPSSSSQAPAEKKRTTSWNPKAVRSAASAENKAGGLFSLKRKADAPAEGGSEAKKPAGARPRKPLIMGGLLGRMQAKQQLKQQQQEQQDRQESPEPSTSASERATPEPKKARSEATAVAARSGEKIRTAKKDLPATPASLSSPGADAPKLGRSLLSARGAGAKAAVSAAPASVNSESAEEGDSVAGGSHFLSFATTMSSAASSEAPLAVSELAKSLQALARSGDAEASLRNALAVLAPAGPAPPRVLAAAVAEAFGEPAVPGLSGEALAAKALGDRQRKRSLRRPPQLTLAEVAETMTACCGGPDEVCQPTVERLAKLLSNTQTEGMEVFLLVRALQGRVGPSREVVHGALARMLARA